jgi:hypothetical protein
MEQYEAVERAYMAGRFATRRCMHRRFEVKVPETSQQPLAIRRLEGLALRTRQSTHEVEECMNIRKLLASFWRRKPLPSSEPDSSSLAHMRATVAMVAQTQDGELGYDEVYALLDVFADRVSRGEDVATLMPLVQQHACLPDAAWRSLAGGEYDGRRRLKRRTSKGLLSPLSEGHAAAANRSAAQEADIG